MATTEPTEADWLEGNDPITTRERFEEATTDEYTPTTEEIRERHSNFVTEAGGMVERIQQRNAEFDRWLAERIARAKAEALEDFAQKLSGHYTLNFESGVTMHEHVRWLLNRDAGIIREAVQS